MAKVPAVRIIVFPKSSTDLGMLWSQVQRAVRAVEGVADTDTEIINYDHVTHTMELLE